MRRTDREITAPEELWSILNSCKVCRLAMCDGEEPYIVPLNFGALWRHELPTLYFHCAGEGRKLQVLRKNPRVCFEMDCDHRLVESEVPCGYGYGFRSLIGTGMTQTVTDTEEKKIALACLMRWQTGRDFEITSAMADAVTVLRLDVEAMTGKRRA